MNSEIKQPEAEPVRTIGVGQQPAPGVDYSTGIDWSRRTTTEALAAGVAVKVLCADGWYLPRD